MLVFFSERCGVHRRAHANMQAAVHLGKIIGSRLYFLNNSRSRLRVHTNGSLCCATVYKCNV